MVTPGRSFSAGSQYRYGFNGKENDRDISDGAQDYGMRINDVRLGRFLSSDPLSPKYPELTPYQFAGNTPIEAIDLDGLEPFHMVSSRGASNASVGALWEKSKRWWNSSSERSDKITKAYEHQLTGAELGNSGEKASNGTAVTWGIASFFRHWANGNSSTAGMSSDEEQTPLAAGKTKITTPIAEDVAASTSAPAGINTAEETGPQLLVGQYKNNKMAGMSSDHIPSFASLKQQRMEDLGRDLTPVELKTLKDNSLTMIINTRLHQTKSETFGGNNTLARQLSDAGNPLQAIRSNVNAYRPTLLSNGYTNTEIDGAIQRLSVPFLPPPTTQQAPAAAPHH